MISEDIQEDQEYVLECPQCWPGELELNHDGILECNYCEGVCEKE